MASANPLYDCAVAMAGRATRLGLCRGIKQLTRKQDVTRLTRSGWDHIRTGESPMSFDTRLLASYLGERRVLP